MMNWLDRWKGSTCVVLASGPSLVKQDIERVRVWREQNPTLRKVMVTNTTFRDALWADAVFGHDFKWFKVYIDEIEKTFKGARICAGQTPAAWRVDRMQNGKPLNGRHYQTFGNSGAASISLAIYAGCTKVIMLGFDCTKNKDGEVHHHGNHPAPLGNGGSMGSWPLKFEKLHAFALANRVEVVNCSRHTILTYFERRDLAQELETKC